MTKNGKTYHYILTVQDVFSRCVWLRPLTKKTSHQVARKLSKLYSEVGSPRVIQSDNGGEFKKAVEKLCHTLGIKIIRGSPYHPQPQGKVERSHRSLRRKIAFGLLRFSKVGVNWASKIREYQTLIKQTDSPEFCLSHSKRKKEIRSHISNLKELRWLPVKEYLYYRDAVMPFKCLTGCAPGYLSTQFIRRCDVTNRRTRSSQMLNIPRFRTASGQRTFYYRAVTLWNTLSNDLKLCESVDQFKRRLRSRLLSNFCTSA